MFRVSFDYVLGIRPTYKGLLIDPVIPSRWDTFSASRKYRGTLYNITVENPQHVEKGVKEIFVNGTRIDGNVLPLTDSKECTIKVIMG